MLYNNKNKAGFHSKPSKHQINQYINQIDHKSFVNNTYTVATTDMGNIPSRQSLSQILKPNADNGDQGGHLPPNPRPPGR